MELDFNLIWESFPALLKGLIKTIELAAISLPAGLCLALVLGIRRGGRPGWLSRLIFLYTYTFRGTPLLIQLFMIYYGLAQFGFVRDGLLWPVLREGYYCSLLAFVLNTTAYTTEIVRGAVQNVPSGEVEAARAIGMSYRLSLRRIILPQAFRIMLPAYSNEVVLMLQATSVASLVTVQELTGTARMIIASAFAPYEIYGTIALMYLAMSYFLILIFKILELHLMRHLRSRLPGVAGERPLMLR